MKPTDYACVPSNAPSSMRILRNGGFMLGDPNNRLVADTLEQEWNDKLRVLADARDQRERSQQQERLILDDAIRDRLIAMTADFKTLWRDPSLANRERKRLLAYLFEDVTLLKLPDEGTTKIHVRFKAGKTETAHGAESQNICTTGQNPARGPAAHRQVSH